ncbi:MAG: flavodoxin family protein [Desulfovibrio sp.]|uniref:flavodoxin family protein n=1 Tax=Desulfovibrio sp. TaxID=885 RepID=UPI001A660C44|nr:flavodoxin family protein [Desulfovibrio sp.]MBD5416524.1 flavodoxin family protein [Desulfovibrio sp.]
MKVLALNGSSNARGVTRKAIDLVGEELAKSSIGLDVLHIGAKPVAGCLDCRKCKTNGHHCIHNDIVNSIWEKLQGYDGLVLGCPAHYMGIPGPFKACMDRLLYSTDNLEGWGPKPACAIGVCRRGGAVGIVHQLGNYLNCSNLLAVNSQYWNVVFGWTPEEFLSQDIEGVATMRTLGRNMAWILQVIEAAGNQVPKPVYEKRPRTNFCR